MSKTYRVDQSDWFIGVRGCCNADELDHVWYQSSHEWGHTAGFVYRFQLVKGNVFSVLQFDLESA
jgi:hypothetical protein